MVSILVFCLIPIALLVFYFRKKFAKKMNQDVARIAKKCAYAWAGLAFIDLFSRPSIGDFVGYNVFLGIVWAGIVGMKIQSVRALAEAKPTVERLPNGEMLRWKYAASDLELDADFTTQQLRIVSSKGERHEYLPDKSGKFSSGFIKGAVNVTYPFRRLEAHAHEIQKHEFKENWTRSVRAVPANRGQTKLVNVSTYHGSEIVGSYGSGRFDWIITHRPIGPRDPVSGTGLERAVWLQDLSGERTTRIAEIWKELTDAISDFERTSH